MKTHRLRRLGLRGEVGKTLGLRDVGHTQAGLGKGVGQGLGRVGILHVGAAHGRVNQGHDAAKLRGGRELGVAADGGDLLGEGVEVLLGGDESGGGGDDLGVSAELSNDLVGELKLKRQVSHRISRHKA